MNPTDTTANNHTTGKPHWHILGAGAIGGLFALRFHQLGFAVTLLSRSSESSARSMTFRDGSHNLTLDFPQQLTRGPLPNAEAISHLLVTTKSFDAAEAVRSVAQRLSSDATVVLLCNGMGYHREIATAIAPARVIAATTTAGCTRTEPDTHLLTGTGQTLMGWLDASEHHAPDRPPDWFATLNRSPWSCQWSPCIEPALLRKVAINAVINPATALHDVANGALLQPPLRATFEQATKEVCALLRWSGNNALAEQLPTEVEQVALGTATNTSSMRADVLAGRPTEINEIIGFLLRQLTAQAPAVKRPVTPLLSEWLSALQRPAPNP